jgi:hypothetical protein
MGKLNLPVPADGRVVNDELTYLINNAVYNVKDFGAKGDGVRDDTGSINNAIDACVRGGGGCVSAPKGTYNFTTLLIPANVRLVGAGMGATTLQKIGSESGDLIFGVRLTGDRAGFADCSVKGLGYSASFVIAVAITNSAKHCLIDRVEVSLAWIGINGGGISGDVARSWDDCSYNLIRDCYVHDVGVVTITMFAPVIAYGNRIVECVTTDTHDAAASGNELRNQCGSIFLGCRAERLRSSFRFEEASRQCAIASCTSKGATREGFLALGYISATGAVGETRDCLITDCFSEGDLEGFLINTADGITMANCIAVGVTDPSAFKAGFRISASSALGASRGANTQIVDCTAKGCAGSGFRCDGNPGDGSAIGANSIIKGQALNNVNGVSASGAAADGVVVDVRATGNSGANFSIGKPTWEVRAPAGATVVLLNGGGANVSPDACSGTLQKIRVTNNTAFQVNNPTNENAGALLTFSIENASGGAMGAITWSTKFKLAGAFTNPATGNLREITFRYDSSNSVFREFSRSAADQAV